MNFGLRCGQLMSERSALSSMTIIERSALWYRLERIGKPPIIPDAPKVIYKRRPVDDELDQVKLGYLDLQKKLHEHIDLARAKAKPKSKWD